MNTKPAAIEPNRLSVRVSIDGDTIHRTTISIPECLRLQYVEEFGSPETFRKALNEAMQEAVPRPGLTRSMAVRLILDKRLGR